MRVDSSLTIGVDELRPKEWEGLFRTLTFEDADGREHFAFEWLRGRRQVRLPRGAWTYLPSHVTYEDHRIRPAMPRLDYAITLDGPGREDYRQADALSSMKLNEQGIVVRPPGEGKTEIALAFVAWCKTRTLVLVHTHDILQQWIERANRNVPGISVGTVQGSTWRVGHITVATVQTALDYAGNKQFWMKFGCLIADECHHAPASTWSTILNACPAYYRFGLTATDKRSDGMEPMMQHLIGPVIHRKKFKPRIPTTVVPVKTKFKYAMRGPYDWRPMIQALVNDEDRNALIAETAVRQLQKGCATLLLSSEIKHLQNIYDHISLQVGFDEGWLQQVEILTGKKSKAVRDKAWDDFRSGKLKLVLATQLANEALDVPILSRIILAFPSRSFGPLLQKVGRALRTHDEKHGAMIFDVYDPNVRTLHRQWGLRQQHYRSMKIEVKKRNGEAKHDKKERKEAGRVNRTEGQRRRNLHRLVTRRSRTGTEDDR